MGRVRNEEGSCVHRWLPMELFDGYQAREFCSNWCKKEDRERMSECNKLARITQYAKSMKKSWEE